MKTTSAPIPHLESLETRTLLASITGTAYIDYNYSGRRETVEGTTQSPTIFIDADSSGTPTAGELTAVVQANGSYTLSGLPAGTHRVRAVPPAGSLITQGASDYLITVTASEVKTGNDFGVHVIPAAGTISGYNYRDDNNSGMLDAGDELSSTGTAFVDLNGNAVYDASEPAAASDTRGNFTISGLAPGTYTVRFFSNSYQLVIPSTQAYQVTVSGSQGTTGVGFGMQKIRTSISGRVVLDPDQDGPGPMDLMGVYSPGVALYVDLNNNSQREPTEPLTQAAGSLYSFLGLAPGTYTVRAFPGPGYKLTGPTSQTVSVTDTEKMGVNFGAVPSATPATVSGTVFWDSNNNGAKDTSESGTYSVRVYLDVDNDNVWDTGEASSLTDQGGHYAILSAPGNYTVRAVLESNRFQTSPLGNAGHSVSLTSSSVVTGKNFGTQPPSTIYGQMFNDANGNGTRDTGETGMIGYLVYIDENNDGQRQTGERSALTDVGGNYFMDLLGPGTYVIRQIVPSGYRQVTPATPAYTLSPNGRSVQAHFANTLASNATITGFAYNDANDNGVKDAIEGGTASATVWIDSDDDGAIDTNEQKTMSNALGEYTLGVVPGTYRIRALFGLNQLQTQPGAAGRLVTVATGQTSSGNNFGAHNYAPGVVSGTVFNDANSNGIKDIGETGISGVYVFYDSNRNGVLNPAPASDVVALTDANGNWSMQMTGDLFSYRFAFHNQTGRALTSPAVGYYEVVPHAGQTSGGNNFGLAPAGPAPTTGSLSGYAFNDTNANGKFDTGDSRASGKVVFLDLNANNKLDTGEKSVTTDSQGNWAFANLAAGVYHVRRTFPLGYSSSTPLIDVTLAPGQTLTGLTIGSRTGTYPPPPPPPTPGTASISGVYFNDIDGDGIRETGENGLSGATIFLDTDGDGVADSGELKSTSGADGSFSFTALPAGSYKVRRAVPSGWKLTTALADVTLTSGQAFSGVQIGVMQNPVTPPPPTGTTGSIKGYAFNDANKNGVRDGTETTASGKVVFIDTNNNGRLDSGEKNVTTDSAGNWGFTGLLAGTYKIRRVFPAGYTYSTKLIDIVLSSGQNVTGQAIGSKTV